MNPSTPALVRFVPTLEAAAESAAVRRTAEVFIGNAVVPVGWVQRTCRGETAPLAHRHQWNYCLADGRELELTSFVSEHQLCRQVAEFYLAAVRLAP